jgi:hypothetical protein
MTLSPLIVTLTDPLLIDGWIEAANRNGTTPEAFAVDFLETQGWSFVEQFGIGVVTSGAFVRRFTATEYASILEAAEKSPEVNTLVDELTTHAKVTLNDPRLLQGLELLANAGLITTERVGELLTYDRPKKAEA